MAVVKTTFPPIELPTCSGCVLSQEAQPLEMCFGVIYYSGMGLFSIYLLRMKLLLHFYNTIRIEDIDICPIIRL